MVWKEPAWKMMKQFCYSVTRDIEELRIPVCGKGGRTVRITVEEEDDGSLFEDILDEVSNAHTEGWNPTHILMDQGTWDAARNEQLLRNKSERRGFSPKRDTHSCAKLFGLLVEISLAPGSGWRVVRCAEKEDQCQSE